MVFSLHFLKKPRLLTALPAILIQVKYEVGRYSRQTLLSQHRRYITTVVGAVIHDVLNQR